MQYSGLFQIDFEYVYTFFYKFRLLTFINVATKTFHNFLYHKDIIFQMCTLN